MTQELHNTPGTVIGYRKDGRPIHVIAGGAPDPADAGDGQQGGTARFFSQEEVDALIEKTRQQEKDKLYPTISKADERSKAMQDELRELRAFQKKQEKEEADRKVALEAEKQRAAEAEMSAKELIAKRDKEFSEQMARFQQEQSQRVALMEKELEFTKLQNYIQRRVSEESEFIAPELTDFIDGETVEAVEASIERVKSKTAQIVENMKAAGIRQRAAMPGVAPATGTNGIGPLDAMGTRTLDADDIKAMGMKEFRELRAKLGMGSNGNEGLFRA